MVRRRLMIIGRRRKLKVKSRNLKVKNMLGATCVSHLFLLSESGFTRLMDSQDRCLKHDLFDGLNDNEKNHINH